MQRTTLGLALVALALMTGACSSTLYTETDDEVRIRFGGGGFAQAKARQYREIAAKGKPVVIDGQVISADAFLAFSVPGACYTENAVFSPHAASYLGLVPARGLTEWLTRKLPEPLEEWFRGNMAYYDWIGFAEVDYDQLIEIWPEGACSGVRAAARAAAGDAPAQGAPVASQTAP